MTAWEADADLVIVGTGVAGLTAALSAQALGLRVLVATKAYDSDAAASWFPTACGPGTRVAVIQNGVEHVARFQKSDKSALASHRDDAVIRHERRTGK